MKHHGFIQLEFMWCGAVWCGAPSLIYGVSCTFVHVQQHIRHVMFMCIIVLIKKKQGLFHQHHFKIYQFHRLVRIIMHSFICHGISWDHHPCHVMGDVMFMFMFMSCHDNDSLHVRVVAFMSI